MSMTVQAAAEVMREAMRDTVKRHSIWYLVQSALMIVAGVLAVIFPAISSAAVMFYIGWLLIISGVLHVVGLIDARGLPTVRRRLRQQGPTSDARPETETQGRSLPSTRSQAS